MFFLVTRFQILSMLMKNLLSDRSPIISASIASPPLSRIATLAFILLLLYHWLTLHTQYIKHEHLGKMSTTWKKKIFCWNAVLKWLDTRLSLICCVGLVGNEVINFIFTTTYRGFFPVFQNVCLVVLLLHWHDTKIANIAGSVWLSLFTNGCWR